MLKEEQIVIGNQFIQCAGRVSILFIGSERHCRFQGPARAYAPFAFCSHPVWKRRAEFPRYRF